MSEETPAYRVERGCDQGVHQVELWADEKAGFMGAGGLFVRCPRCKATFAIDSDRLGIVLRQCEVYVGEPVGPKVTPA